MISDAASPPHNALAVAALGVVVKSLKKDGKVGCPTAM